MELGGVDEKRVRELTATALSLEADPSLIAHLIAETRSLAGVDRAAVYSLAQTTDGLRVEFGDWDGFSMSSGRANEIMSASIARSGPFAAYDALRPDPRQRDRPVWFARPALIMTMPGRGVRDRSLSARDREALGIRVRTHREMFRSLDSLDLEQLRILICDGPRLLGWYGLFAQGGFTRRQRALLRVLAAPMRKRLRLERELRVATQSTGVIDAALAAIEAPAFVVRRSGVICHVNSIGEALLDRRPTEILATLRQAIATGAAPGVDVFAVPGSGSSALRLVVLRARSQSSAVRQLAAIARWQLTPREGEVLALIVAGDTNREIATTLCCAEGTVEIHVTRILRKAGVAGRAALVTAYWNPA